MTLKNRLSSNKNSIMLENSTDSLLTNTPITSIKLYKYNEIPEWQKDNHYILDGYVKETNSINACLHSLTYLHNESVNIYTHFIPGFLFPLSLLIVSPILFFFYYEYFSSSSSSSSSTTLFPFLPFLDIPLHDQNINDPQLLFTDRLFFSIFFIGFTSCLSLSACFHCLKSHSHKIMIFGNQLDYFGIVILIVSSMVGIIHYSLIDTIKFKYIFQFMIISLGLLCSYISLNSKFRSSKWRPFRATMFVLFGLSGLIPISFGFFKFGLLETYNRAGLKFVLLEALGYIFGAFLYAIRFPESLKPGFFDIWGHSHQLFHILVVISAYCHYKGLILAYNYSYESTLL